MERRGLVRPTDDIMGAKMADREIKFEVSRVDPIILKELEQLARGRDLGDQRILFAKAVLQLNRRCSDITAALQALSEAGIFSVHRK